MTSISVLHLLNGFAPSSISWIVKQIVHHLRSDEFVWHVAGLSNVGIVQEDLRNLGVNVIDLFEGKMRSYPVWKNLRDQINFHGINIIHTHSPRAIYISFLAGISCRGFIHVDTKHLLASPFDRRFGYFFAAMDRMSLYFPNQLVAVSETIKKRIELLPGVTRNRVTMIRNAVDCDYYQKFDQRNSCRKEFGIDPKAHVIGFTGRIEKVKRLDVLVEAFKQVVKAFPLSKLIIVGEGTQKQKIMDLSERLGIADDVIWTGFRQDIPRLLAMMDIFVQPSVNEGLSLSLLEAMSARVPVIATNVGGTSEVVIDNQTGILVPTGSSLALSEAILSLLNDEKLRTNLIQAAEDKIRNEFNISHMVNAYRDLYVTLMKQKNTKPL